MVKLKYWYNMKEDIEITITTREGTIVARNSRYLSYDFSTSYGTLTGSFNITYSNEDTKRIEPGQYIILRINGVLEFRGIIQRLERNITKGGITVSLSGKDRSSILVESFANKYPDYSGKTPKYIIDELIKQTNFYATGTTFYEALADTLGTELAVDLTDRNNVVQFGFAKSRFDLVSFDKEITEYDQDFEALNAIKEFKISPGDVIYDKISELVISAGFEVLYEQNGKLYIGDLAKKRKADKVTYQTTLRSDHAAERNNVIESSLADDISGRYYAVEVSCQSEGENSSGFIFKRKIATDTSVNVRKHFSQTVDINDDTNNVINIEKLAIQIREDQRIDGFNLTHKVAGHVADNGHAWRINRYCKTVDQPNNIDTTLIVNAVTFSFSENDGATTTLGLAKERSNKLIYHESYVWKTKLGKELQKRLQE